MRDINKEELAARVESEIHGYLSGEAAVGSLGEIFGRLPADRDTALALVLLTEVFDLYEIYNVLLSDLACFLNHEELCAVWKKAEALFEPEVLDGMRR